MTTKSNLADNSVLNWIERSGNKLPDPVFIFVWCIFTVIIISVIASFFGYSAFHPTLLDETGNKMIIHAESLLSASNIQRLLVDMPSTFTDFHPLGYVLVVMLGAGVAERSGLFATAMSASMSKAPKFLLTPAVALIGMIGNLAADAAYVVLIPLAGVVFAAANRHPIAGIAAAFAGVSGGFSANLIPGQLEPLLFGITEAAAESLDPSWNANMVGNWYFISGMTLVFLPVIWFVTDRIIEPRLNMHMPSDGKSQTAGIVKSPESELTQNEIRGLRYSGLALLGVVFLWILLCVLPGTPLINESEQGISRFNPLLQSLVAGFFILFLAVGWAYGHGAGSIKDHRDVVKMMSESMSDLAYYLVLAFTAAHFVAMFNWSNLGLIFAINGASFLETSNLPDSILLSLIILFGAIINLFIGSASAKWALLAPVLVPMLMLLGISPEMSTAAYRVGDGATNIITPLMPYFPLILIFCQRWQKEFGIGSLAATMLPFSIALLLSGLVMTALWVIFSLPLGPNAPVEFVL
ncbi:MAG: hypothetical protein CMQ26_08065 [Gammaproteobacteria bacterium]|nr:hypothetical protein [Gammaproteobacteria bacterium]MBS27021.1 hypothetical protein [Gammaproteobacteria bacterium]|tara:strand:+ start:4623 stop:6191 length:1569 start_codon:yes stop_codon:yes gene_type:complete